MQLLKILEVDPMPHISVILPTYNRAHKIKKAIESVLSQTYSDIELIIADDASTDDTKDVVKSVSDDRLHYYLCPENKGAAAARNFGIKKASPSSEWIAFEDSDDLWHPDKLEKELLSLPTVPEAEFCYHKIRYDMGGGYSAILPDERIPLEKKSGDIFAELLHENLVDCPSMLIKKTLLERTGLFDETLPALEDYDLAIRLGKNSKAAFTNEVLLESAYSTTGVSGSPKNYLIASCLILSKYKKDYLETDNFNHRLSIILSDAEKVGVKDEIVAFLEKLLSLS